MTQSRLAELLGVSKERFRALLRERRVPYQDVAEAEFLADVSAAEAHATRKPV